MGPGDARPTDACGDAVVDCGVDLPSLVDEFGKSPGWVVVRPPCRRRRAEPQTSKPLTRVLSGVLAVAAALSSAHAGERLAGL